MHRKTVVKALEKDRAPWLRRGLIASLLVGAALATAWPALAQQPEPADEPAFLDTEAAMNAVTKTEAEKEGFDLYRRGLYPEAINFWTEAVKNDNDPGSAYRLGEEYRDGKVVTRDLEKAYDYYKIAAERGDPRAQMDLGSMYDNGTGIPKDPQFAAKWYEAAAKQGMPEAQYNIAVMYEEGIGVPQSDVKAYMYLLLAIQNGFTTFATTELEKLSQTMSPADIKQATAMAKDFKAEPTGE